MLEHCESGKYEVSVCLQALHILSTYLGIIMIILYFSPLRAARMMRSTIAAPI